MRLKFLNLFEKLHLFNFFDDDILHSTYISQIRIQNSDYLIYNKLILYRFLVNMQYAF
jgi:hypothetical protein